MGYPNFPCVNSPAIMDRLLESSWNCDEATEPVLSASRGLCSARAPSGTEAKATCRCRPPGQFVCPISCDLMVDPVVTCFGQTFERAEIFQWFRHRDTDPVTNQRVQTKRLVPNLVLRQLIQAWQEMHDCS